MADEESKSRLTEITTIWDEVRLSQRQKGPEAQDACEALFQRYSGAARRYLLAALGDAAAAEDLTQEFGLALVEGKFYRADPQHGRFREYLKGVLFRLVSQYRRRQKKRGPLFSGILSRRVEPEVKGGDEQFNQSWRDELLARAWAALADANSSYFTVLHFRASHPDMPAEQMAREVGPQLGKSLSAENLRQTLHRARKAFADLLLDDVKQSLEHPTAEAVQEELRDLELASYFRGHDA